MRHSHCHFICSVSAYYIRFSKLARWDLRLLASRRPQAQEVNETLRSMLGEVVRRMPDSVRVFCARYLHAVPGRFKDEGGKATDAWIRNVRGKSSSMGDISTARCWPEVREVVMAGLLKQKDTIKKHSG